MARAALAAVACALVLAAPAAVAQAGTCFPAYTCMHTFNLMGFK